MWMAIQVLGFVPSPQEGLKGVKTPSCWWRAKRVAYYNRWLRSATPNSGLRLRLPPKSLIRLLQHKHLELSQNPKTSAGLPIWLWAMGQKYRVPQKNYWLKEKIDQTLWSPGFSFWSIAICFTLASLDETGGSPILKESSECTFEELAR